MSRAYRSQALLRALQTAYRRPEPARRYLGQWLKVYSAEHPETGVVLATLDPAEAANVARERGLVLVESEYHYSAGSHRELPVPPAPPKEPTDG